MGVPLKQKFQGKTYKSFTDLCKAYGFTEGSVRMRLKRKWSLKEALGVIYRKSGSPGRDKKIEINGKIFKSIKIACRYFKIPKYLVYQRLKKRNYTINQAFNLEPPPIRKNHNLIEIIVGGKKFKSKREAANFYNVNEKLVDNRINRDGWSIDEAYEIKPRLPNKNFLLLNNGKKRQGYLYVIINKINKKKYIGITIGAIKDRFASHLYKASKNSNKHSLERAIWDYGSKNFICKKLKKISVEKLGYLERLYIKKFQTRYPKGYNINSGGAGIFGGANYQIPIILNDKIFLSISDLGRYLNIKPQTLAARVRSGLSIKDAISKKIRPFNSINYKGKNYKTINHAARAFGLNISTVRDRIRRKWTIRKALTTSVVS